MALKTCTRAAGAVGAYAQIEIRLSQDTIITATSANYLAAWIKVTAAADGSYSVQLQANADLTPANTYYTVSEYAGTSSNTYSVVVPSTAGPFDLSTIQVSPPPAASALVALDAQVVHLANPETITGVKVFSALVVHSAGNETSGYSGTFTPQWIDVLGGTLAAGDTVAQPSVKVSRYLNLQGSQIPVGIGLDEGSLIYGSVTVPTTGQVPGTAVFGLAKTQSTSSGATGGGGQSISADAQGVVGVGQALSGSTRVGIGGYFEGNAQAAGGLLSGVQIGARNSTGVDATAPAAAFSQSQGLWLTSLGTNQAAEAIAIGNPSGRQFDVGLHANGQASGGFTGGIATAFIQDDSTAATSILVKGTHSTGAIAVAAGAGSVVLGGTTFSFTPALLEVRGISGTSYTPLAVFSGSGAADDVSVRVRNGSGSSDYFAAGATNHIINGAVAGDTGIVINTSGHHFLMGPGTGAALVVGQDGIVGINNGIAMGGGAAPTLGTIGGSGPATAAQNSWLKVNIAGVASYIPIWR